MEQRSELVDKGECGVQPVKGDYMGKGIEGTSSEIDLCKSDVFHEQEGTQKSCVPL